MHGMDTEPDAERVAVYRGLRTACRECALVLESKGLPYDVIDLDGTSVLLVSPEAAESARDEIARYEAERRIVRDAPPTLIPFGGAGLGAGIYAAVLLIIAYCAGIQWLGMDWLASGALEPRAGAGEWWRAVAALTLHMDQAHLLGNLLFGAGIGILAGRVFGPGLAWASILGAAAAANYLEMLISPSTHSAVGASTAVFAALGLLTGCAWRQRLTLRERFRYRWAPLFAGVCLLGFLGAGGEHVDVLGHGLGFATGVALGWIYARAHVPRSRGRGLQLGAGATALGLVAAAWIFALRHGVRAI
jgi:membrane associated rhomboid family serine protease